MLARLADGEEGGLDDFGGGRVGVDAPFAAVDQLARSQGVAAVVVFAANQPGLQVEAVGVLGGEQQGVRVEVDVGEQGAHGVGGLAVLQVVLGDGDRAVGQGDGRGLRHGGFAGLQRRFGGGADQGEVGHGGLRGRGGFRWGYFAVGVGLEE